LTIEKLSLTNKNPNHIRILILTETAVSELTNEIIDKSIWQKILILPHQKTINFSKAKRFIDNWIKHNDLKNIKDQKEIFINDDKRWRNQLLITGIKADRISLIEDGMGAYVRNNFHPIRDKIYRGLILKYFFQNRLINTGLISSVPADRFFAFRNSAYHWFGPNRELHLLDYKKSEYIKKISQRSFINSEKERVLAAQLIILTCPLAEASLLSIEKECRCWQKAALILSQYNKVVIKSHPAESEIFFQKRITALTSVLHQSSFIKIDSRLPAEILLCNNDINADIFSPSSTTLMNLKSIRPDLNVYHGFDLFFPHRMKKISKNSSFYYYSQLGIPSILKINIKKRRGRDQLAND
jgi:hypothetical protein